MFETAELGSKMTKDEYRRELPQLRVDLINAQYDLRQADFPVLIAIVGDDRRGVSEVVNRLNEWMDARYIHTQVFGAPTEADGQRPRNWRYWRALPARGELAIYTGDFALDTISDRLAGTIGDGEFDLRLEHMARFEQALNDDGALVLKFWIHLPEDVLKRRVKKASRRRHHQGGDRLDVMEQLVLDSYGEVRRLSERVLYRTESSAAPWRVIESTNNRYRDLTVARVICRALTERLSSPPRPELADPAPASAPSGNAPSPVMTVLDAVDLTARVDRSEYKARLRELQTRLRQLCLRAREAGLSSIAVFEGWDAAGKGGVIRRITHAVDVQDYRIVPVGEPTAEELDHHYLWRFWRELPAAGRLLIFDRSWYGRVLVERVERLVPAAVWQRAYGEINDFEEQIVEFGVPLFKFWLDISPDEQLRRFQAREQAPYKKYKITDADYRNRGQWESYRLAVNEMVQRTSTDFAPWTLVAAEDKRHARLTVRLDQNASTR